MEVIEETNASPLAFLTDNAIASTISDAYSSLQTKRKALGLENPGTVENIHREVQREVLLSNYMFSGLRCDLQKMFSISPLFRMQHGFAIGSPALPSWQMISIYGTSSVRTIQAPSATPSC
jgi:mitochondrial import receptor subunit TOM40